MSKKMELPVKCIKCEMEIKRIDLEDDVVPKKGEYINDIMGMGCGCVDKGIAPGILVEMINPSFVSASSEEEGTFHGFMCDGCLQELTDKKIIKDGPEEYKKRLIYGREGYENSDILRKVPEEELRELRNKIIAEYEGKDVSLNQLLLDYGSNELVDVSIPDGPLDCGEWKDLLERVKKIGSSDITLVKVSEAGFVDAVSLKTHKIRIMITDPTVELMMRLMEIIVDLEPYSADCQNGYIEVVF